MKTKLLLTLGVLWFAVAAVAAPAHVLIRVPPGQPLPAELAPLLAKWRHSGQITSALLLTQGRVENPVPGRTAKFEALAVLGFPNETACEIWAKDAAPALPAGLIVRRADVLAHAEFSPRDSSHAVFIVNTYTPLVPAARFAEYVAGYVQPLYEAMHATQHLVRYTAFLERGETGKVDALNVLEYRDAAAFSAVTAMKTKIRDQVAAAVPTYRQFDKIKDTLRVDGFGTTATSTELPPPK
jgi:hypothetical protein